MGLSDNKSTVTILVSGASGIVGYGTVRSLKKCGFKVIGTTIYDVSPADCFCDMVLKAPLTSDEGYIRWLTGIIREYDVDMIIPGIEADMKSWNENREEINKTGVCILLNNSKLIENCLDKWSFYCTLKDNGFENRIETSIDADVKRFAIPFILKPRCGFGSKGLIKVLSRDDFENNKDRIGDELMMQEYVGTDDE